MTVPPAGGRPALLLLNGGRSTRMGRDKASLLVGGVPLGSRPVAALRDLCGPVVVAGPAPPGVEANCVPDAVPNAGPLGGLVAALEAAPAARAVVVATDMPGVVAALVARLLTALDAHPDAGVVVCRSERGLEPFPAALRREAAVPLRSALEAGTRAVRDAYAAAGLLVLPPEAWRETDPSGASFVNWNRPEDVPPDAGRGG